MIHHQKRAKTHYRNRTKRAIWNMIKCDLMQRKTTSYFKTLRETIMKQAIWKNAR